MQQKGVQWFPGHMQKALRQIEEKLKHIDVVIEIVDCRVPLSSKNPFLNRLIANKKRLLVMSKSDLADLKTAVQFKEYYQNQGYEVVLADLSKKKDIEEIRLQVSKLGQEKNDRYRSRGLKPQPLRTMILGIPNVGKSTLINRLSGRYAASIANTPGHTKAQQWIKVDKQLELLDTPGILPPHYEDRLTAINLALIGSMKEQNVPLTVLLDRLFVVIFTKNLVSNLESRYGISLQEPYDQNTILEMIAKSRGLLLKGGEIDYNRAERLLLKEFKEGLIAKVVLDEVPYES